MLTTYHQYMYARILVLVVLLCTGFQNVARDDHMMEFHMVDILGQSDKVLL